MDKIVRFKILGWVTTSWTYSMSKKCHLYHLGPESSSLDATWTVRTIRSWHWPLGTCTSLRPSTTRYFSTSFVCLSPFVSRVVLNVDITLKAQISCLADLFLSAKNTDFYFSFYDIAKMQNFRLLNM